MLANGTIALPDRTKGRHSAISTRQQVQYQNILILNLLREK
jgi:hypothetical protein